MKKISLVMGLMASSAIGIGVYSLMNKNTKSKANAILNNVLDKTKDITSNMNN